MRNGAAMRGSFTLQPIDIGKRGFDKLRARAFLFALTRLKDSYFFTGPKGCQSLKNSVKSFKRPSNRGKTNDKRCN